MAMGWRILPAATGFMIAIQDLDISNNNYKHILKDLNITNYICRICQKLETIQHIIGACCTLAQRNYTHHHNHFVHQQLGIKCGLSKGTPMSFHTLKLQSVLKNSNYKLCYDRSVITDWTFLNNRPHILILDKTTEDTYLIDVAIPNSHNLHSTITPKLQKYSGLKELIRIWQMKTAYVRGKVIK